MKVVRWFLDYWYIPLGIIGAVMAWIFVSRFKSGSAYLQQVRKELSAIGAKRKAREVEIRSNAETARSYVRSKYKAELETLNARNALKVKELENDPSALAAYLDRLGSS